MRKLLLSSSSTSVLASASLVILCTLALFLSGYTIQQRTLRQLRASIRPRESPTSHLPERFRTTPVFLEDGTPVLMGDGRVAVTSEAERSIQAQRKAFDASEPRPPPRPTEKGDEEDDEDDEDHNGNGGGDERQDDEAGGRATGATAAQVRMMEQIRAQVQDKTWMVENPDPLSKDRTPVGRAQRRKMIKDEIQRLARAEEPVYYQRRLW